MSSSILSWQILTAHAQPFRGARDLPFCLKVPLDSVLVWASSGGSGETARMRRLAWTFAARISDKYQIRLTRPNWCMTLKCWVMNVCKIHLKMFSSVFLSNHRVCYNPLTFRWFHKGLAWNQTRHGHLLVDDDEPNTKLNWTGRD